MIGDVALKVATGVVPAAPLMGAFGPLALAANLVCAVLLLRFRSGEINMSSTWLCSRNDVLANLGVLLAAGLVGDTRSLWPDVAVGLLIAGVYLQSALGVFREAASQLAAEAGRDVRSGDRAGRVRRVCGERAAKRSEGASSRTARLRSGYRPVY